LHFQIARKVSFHVPIVGPLKENPILFGIPNIDDESDRVILIEQGKIGLDLPILLPHPRNNMTKTAPLEQIVLDKILAVH
jgi:hypothetical protein